MPSAHRRYRDWTHERIRHEYDAIMEVAKRNATGSFRDVSFYITRHPP
jgi:hypothetical protein